MSDKLFFTHGQGPASTLRHLLFSREVTLVNNSRKWQVLRRKSSRWKMERQRWEVMEMWSTRGERQRKRKCILRWIKLWQQIRCGKPGSSFPMTLKFSGLGDAMPGSSDKWMGASQNEEQIVLGEKKTEFCSWIWGCSSVGKRTCLAFTKLWVQSLVLHMTGHGGSCL